MNYKDLAIKYQDLTDKLSYQGNYNNGHAYAVVYDRLFEPYRNKSIDFLEIGLNFGGNIAICSEYFPNIKHYGIDIADYIKVDKNLFTFYKGSFDDENVINQASERQYDIILEDGCNSRNLTIDVVGLASCVEAYNIGSNICISAIFLKSCFYIIFI
jgi:hypothetical protein